MRHGLIPLGIASILFASAASAQTSTPRSQLFGFRAIILTPAGALPQIVTVDRMMRNHARAGLALRYGRYTTSGFDDTFNNVGVSGWLGIARRAQLGATIGERTCGSCEGLTMGSIDLATTVYHKDASGAAGGDTDFGLQVSAGVGNAKNSDVSAKSLTVSAPLSVTLPQAENSMLSIFLSPSAAYGRLTDTGITDGAARLIIGAGLAYAFEFGLAAHFEAHRVIVKDSPTQIGFALTWAFGPISR